MYMSNKSWIVITIEWRNVSINRSDYGLYKPINLTGPWYAVPPRTHTHTNKHVYIYICNCYCFASAKNCVRVVGNARTMAIGSDKWVALFRRYHSSLLYMCCVRCLRRCICLRRMTQRKLFRESVETDRRRKQTGFGFFRRCRARWMPLDRYVNLFLKKEKNTSFCAVSRWHMTYLYIHRI